MRIGSPITNERENRLQKERFGDDPDKKFRFWKSKLARNSVAHGLNVDGVCSIDWCARTWSQDVC